MPPAVQTPLHSFVKWLETSQSLTFGQDLFAGEAPSTNEHEDPTTWVVMSGGGNNLTFLTGEAHQIFGFDVYHRDVNFKSVQEFAYKLVSDVTCSGCVQLEGFETVEMAAASTPVDNDRDSEDRKVVLIQITAVLKNNC